MTWMRWVELVEDGQGRLSTTSLAVWVGVGALTRVIWIGADQGKTDAGVIGIYAALIATLAGIKKGFDATVEKASLKAATPVGDINVENIERADSLTESGDVNMKPRKKKK